MEQTVTIEFGGAPLTGVADGATVRFAGVSYAHDPVGDRRFAAPDAHAGTRAAVADATRPGPASPQPASRLERVMGRFEAPTSEAGVLHVNVWTPDVDGDRPVLVWLHGGAWSTGSAAWSAYDARALCEALDAVVVTVNARLGVLGFAQFEGFDGADGLDGVDGLEGANLGLRDQAAALEWVHRNISAFGGDPARITVAGQSSGAEAALLLAATEQTRGLVAGVVALSPPTFPTFAAVADARRVSAEILDEAGVAPGDFDALRAVPADVLVVAAGAAAARLARPGQLVPDVRVTTGPLVPWAGIDGAVAALPASTRVLIGSTQHELRAFLQGREDLDALAADELDARIRADFGDEGERYLAAASATERRAAGSVRYADAATEAVHHAPTAHLADLVPGECHLYRVADVGGEFGACHCFDLPLLFGAEAYRAAPMLRGVDEAAFEAASLALRGAARGIVHGEAPAWPRHVAGAGAHVIGGTPTA